ncbi:MAG TPA: phosphotransferase [Steroidobacteraceae bacterium]|nr:phosphotransferase [Steroidobacteraceae bacterium]
MSDKNNDKAIRALPCWTGEVEIVALSGGSTNRNYRVSDHSGQQFVVRMGRDIPEHGVMRFNELAAARAACAAGLAPEVVYAAEGFLVSRFVKGRTLTPADVRAAGQLERIVELLQRCHHEIPRHLQGPALIFWVFQVIRQYLRLLESRREYPYAVAFDTLADQARQLERAVGPVTIAFGHNDLLAANLIDDGERLWLIDWDYAGFNSPLFDLANLASNNAFTPELETRLLSCYFGTGADASMSRGFAAMLCASLLRESLWGAVSRLTSTLDFDYAAYTRDYLQRYEQRWQQFQQHHG